MGLWVPGDEVQQEGLQYDACRQGGRLTSNDRWGSVGRDKWFGTLVPGLLLLN